MRTCLAIVGALVLIVVAGAGFAAWRFNQQFGYTMAEPVSFETRIDEGTRTQVVLNVDTLRDYAVDLVPAELPQMPAWVPGDVHSLMEDFLPRELALLAGANYREGAIDLTVFANERRIGPVIVEQLKSAGVLSRITQVEWEPELFQLEERGVITARGKMAITPDAEGWVLNSTGGKEGATIAKVSGNNLLEIVVDGHDGDFVALVSAMMQAQGATLEEAFADPMVKPMIPFVTNVKEFYADANITGPDEITINLRITMAEGTPREARSPIAMAMMIGFPEIQKRLKANYQLTLEAKDGQNPEWVEEQVFAGAFLLTGFRPIIEQQIQTALQSSAPPAS